jgi:hypothetical protein
MDPSIVDIAVLFVIHSLSVFKEINHDSKTQAAALQSALA